MKRSLVFLPLIVLLTCPSGCVDDAVVSSEETMNPVAEAYVKLALAVGHYDDDYIDAYYGPEAWREEVKAEGRELDAIATEADDLLAKLTALEPPPADEMLGLRRRSLISQLESLRAFVDLLQGASMSFDEESMALYGVVAPRYPESYFQDTLDQLDELLPGEGPVGERLESFRDRFVVPPDRLDAVMRAAIDEARRRMLAHVALPANEDFVLELVQNAPWSAYNWYKGNSQSLIQINTDLPVRIDWVLLLAAHEGYPGHHVYGSLQEHLLVDGRGWVESTVYLLFSPQSMISEGTAEFGVDLVFPAAEKVEFAANVLFPLAGLDGEAAELFFRVEDLATIFWHVETEIARRYLDGDINAEQANQLLVDTALMSREKAAQSVRFWDWGRSYVITYTVGKDMVRAYVEAHAETPDEKWREFVKLLSSPPLPALLLE